MVLVETLANSRMTLGKMKSEDFSVEHFFYQSKNLMFVLDGSLNLKDLNPAFSDLSGYSQKDCGLLNFANIIHPEDRLKTLSIVDNYFQSSDTVENAFTFRFSAASGEYFWLSCVSFFIHQGYIFITAINISKDKETEKDTIETHHLLHEIINLVPHPIFLKDQSGKYLLVNQSQSELFSLSAEELVGKDDSNFIKDIAEYLGVIESDQEVVNHHRLIDLPDQIITTPNGETKILHTTKVPLFSPVDSKVYILGVSVDLTALKNYEEALKQSEEKYRSLVELSPDAIIILENGRILFINDSGVKLFGATSRAEMLGKKFFDFIHPDYYAIILERNKLLKKGERVAALEEKFIQLNGHVIDVEVSSIPFYYKGKSAVQIIAKDISERVKARNSLFKRKQQFEALAENSSDIIARFNRNYEHLYINQSILRFTDKPPEFFINKNISEVDYPERLSKNFKKVIDKVFNSGKSVSMYFTLYATHGLQYCFATIVPEKNKEEKIVSVLCTIRDVTELKLKQNELISINKELNTFIYKASHDLKGPLATILGLSNLSIINPDKTQNEEIFKRIHQTALNLNQTLKKLLEIVEIKDIRLTIKPIDIDEAIFSCINELKKDFDVDKVKFSISLNQSKKFKSDPQIFSSILRNLIKNSIQYKKERFPYINILAEDYKEGLAVTIEDNGVGIEESVKDRVFDMFFRGSIHSTGSGLGLYLVKNAILRLNGKITLESELDKGSKFTVYIPNN